MSSEYRTGYTLGLSRVQFRAVSLLADGKKLDDIAIICFGCADENGRRDEAKFRKAKATLRKWFKDPKLIEAHKELCKEALMPIMMRSLKKVDALIDDKNGWLGFNAATFFLNKYGSMIFGDDDRSIKVEVVGMPDMGTPDDNGTV